MLTSNAFRVQSANATHSVRRIGHALLVNTAYSARDVATALNINDSRVRQRRLAGTLWAINDNGAWVFPALQFETDPQTGRQHKQIRGLDRVFAALAANLHPVAVAGFLRTPVRIWRCGVGPYIRWSGCKRRRRRLGLAPR